MGEFEPVVDAERVVYSRNTWFSRNDDTASIFAEACFPYREVPALLFLLHCHDSIAGAHRFKMAPGIEIAPAFYFQAMRKIRPRGSIEFTIKADDRFCFIHRPGEDRLRSGTIHVADFKEPSFALWPITPVRLTRVTTDHEITSGGNRAIHGEEGHVANEAGLRHIARCGFGETGSPEIAA